MGTWSMPCTKETAATLEKIMAEKITAEAAPEKLYTIFGDDWLFDILDAIEPNTDARYSIAYRLYRILETKSDGELHFNERWQPEAIEICKKILAPYLPTIKQRRYA